MLIMLVCVDCTWSWFRSALITTSCDTTDEFDNLMSIFTSCVSETVIVFIR